MRLVDSTYVDDTALMFSAELVMELAPRAEAVAQIAVTAMNRHLLSVDCKAGKTECMLRFHGHDSR